MPYSPSSMASELVSAGEPVLAGRVVAVARGGLKARRRADDDDGAAVAGLDHRGDRGPQGAPGARQVDPDDGVPLFVGELPEPAPAQHAGVGHQDVEPAELFDAVGHQLAQRRVVAYVRLAGQYLAALGFHQADGLGEVLPAWPAGRSGCRTPGRRCRGR